MIANLDTLACCSKEPWMNPLQPTIQQGIAQLKDFITRLVSCDEAEGESQAPSLLYKISQGSDWLMWGGRCQRHHLRICIMRKCLTHLLCSVNINFSSVTLW